MNEKPVNKNNLLNSLPEEWAEDLIPAIQKQIKASRRKLVVLDDDPTGTQTVHGLPVLTEWPVEALRAEFENDLPAFYILTNSRSVPLAQAQALNRDIAGKLAQAAQQGGANYPFAVVSRSDSTLRGHFPGEVEALAEAIATAPAGHDFDAWLIIPFFLEGGRYTINDIHYVAEGEMLIPAGQTEFARDAAFGYRASNLREWVVEKTGGQIPIESVSAISIESIRRGGPEQVAAQLTGLAKGSVCVINAASPRDLEVFVHGLLTAEASGKHFVYRTAASFVQVRAGLRPRPVLSRADLELPESGGGLIVVGSYVPKTTGQVNALLARPDLVTRLEVSVKALLDDAEEQQEIERVAQQADETLRRNQNVVIYTSRELITGADAGASLAIGQRISAGLIKIVRSISTRPRYLLAKGGITSSDVATKGLEIKRAMVPGQILPGVPLWQAGPESRYPGLAYIVFPGNVGGPEALVEVVEKLN